MQPWIERGKTLLYTEIYGLQVVDVLPKRLAINAYFKHFDSDFWRVVHPANRNNKRERITGTSLNYRKVEVECLPADLKIQALLLNIQL